MAMFELKPSEVEANVVSCIETGLVPFLRSSPGMGKSSIFRKIARKFDLEYIDVRLSQLVPEDLTGLPMKTVNPDTQITYAEFIPFNLFPISTTPIPAGKNGWLLALDEFNSCSKSVQAAAYKLVLDRFVGQEKLHDNVFIVAAGNLDTDRAIVTPLSTAMKSRLIHLVMKPDLEEFTELAQELQFDPRIAGFLHFQPSKLIDFRPDSEDMTYPCPRTWEFASKLIKGKSTDQIGMSLLAGTIGSGAAAEFRAFLREYENLPSYEAILADPAMAPIPGSASARYGLTSMLLDKSTLKDMAKVFAYVKRLPTEFQGVFFRHILLRFPNLRREQVYIDNINHLVKFLKGIPSTSVA